MSRSKSAGGFSFERLEPRILLSADALGGAIGSDFFSADDNPFPLTADDPEKLETLANGLRAQYGTSTASDAAPEALDLDALGAFAGAGDATEKRVELIFVDARVEGYESLLQDLMTDSGNTEYSVVILDAETAGVAQISETLEGMANVDAIHLFSHGNAGGVQLGNGQLNADNLAGYSAAISGWRDALVAGADILVYGCNLAASSQGLSLLDSLADLTGADVAASDDLTGAASLGGDWILEYNNGLIETPVAISLAGQQSWQDVMVAPTTAGISDITIDADAADTVIDLLTVFFDAEDADSDLLYSIVSNTNPGLFAIVPNPDDVANTLTLDYDSATSGSADITVRATDSEALSVDTTFTVTTNAVNQPPSGDVTIDNTSPAEDDVLTASNTLSDADGLSGPITYQWQRDGVDIGGETASTYTAVQADVGAVITVQASYTDDLLTPESKASDATAAVTNVNDLPAGTVTIDNNAPAQGDTLTVSNTLSDEDGLSGAISYQWQRDGVDIGGETGSTYTAVQADVDAVITVQASYTDDLLTPESKTSNATAAVTNVNDLPAGAVSIDNTAPLVGDTLTASNNLSDEDGLSGAISYQWQRDGVDIGGETASTYTAVQADVGAVITVQASYTDDLLTPESVTSAATAAVPEAATLWLSTAGNVVNPLGDPGSIGSWQNQAVVQLGGAGLMLEPGLTGGTFSEVFDIENSGTAFSSIANVNAAHYVTTDLTIGSANSIDVQRGDLIMSLDDSETLTNSDTSTVLVDSDDVFVFRPATQGDYSSGEFIKLFDIPGGFDTTAVTLVEKDTLVGDAMLSAGSFLFAHADGAADNQIQLFVPGDLGAVTKGAISLLIDGNELLDGDTREVIPDAIRSLELIETNMTLGGSPLQSGTILLSIQNDQLVADNALAVEDDDIFVLDVDKTTLFNGHTDATASYLFDGSDVGLGINAEETDALTLAVPVNQLPTGAVTVSGTVTEDQVLTGDASGLADAEGLGAFSYQWLRNGAPIGGATAISYTLGDADVGAVIAMRASYGDGAGMAERVTSAGTTAVVNINDDPVGTPLASGVATEEEILTADTSGVSDADGLGAFSYQWYRSGTPLGGATTSTYMLVDADVGGTLTVKVDYTDANGTVESLTSAPTAAVAESIPTLWFSTMGTPVNPMGDAGSITTWQDQDIVQLGGAGFNLGVGVSSGILSEGFDIENSGTAFATSANITALHYVSSDLLLGTANQLAVQTGDLILSTQDNEVLTNSDTSTVVARKDEIFIFRPDTPGDYASGTFIKPFDVPSVISNISAVTLVESDTTVGDVTLAQGTLLFADSDNQIIRFTPGNLAVDPPGTADVLVDGGELDGGLSELIPSKIDGIDLIETDMTLGGAFLPSGTILLTITNNDTVMDNDLPVADDDIFAITLDKTTLVNGTTVGTASDLFHGADLNLTWNNWDEIDALTIKAPLDGGASNNTPTGAPTISGTATEDQTLTADASAIADADGLGAFSYQWLRDGAPIAGATAINYTLDDPDVGAVITVSASYTDGGGRFESVTSAGTTAVANINDLPAGTVTIDNNSPAEGDTLTAANTLSDDDGISGAISYQWQRDGVDIGGATNATYTAVQADVGAVITVEASYTDDQLTDEAKTSAGTAAVTNVNDLPAGTVTIDNTTPAQGDTLTATNTLTDEDGLSGPITYQWQRDGADIGGATSATYTAVQADVGAVITVEASYTDDQLTDEAKTSAGSAAVTNVNDLPAGAVTIDNTTPAQGNILTASNTLTDVDGLSGPITYQWLRDGLDIGGATGTSYTVVLADVGALISVRASYTDDLLTPENKTSAATAVVAGDNDAALWISTTSDVTAATGGGINAWHDQDVIQLGGAGFVLGPDISAGTFSEIFDIENSGAPVDFIPGASNVVEVDALHHVTTNLTIGTSNSVDVFAGDLILSVDASYTLTNTDLSTLNVDNDDVFVFRPATPGDYSSGEFIKLFKIPVGQDVVGITLVEKNTQLGTSSTILQQGSFLFTTKNPSLDALLRIYSPADLAAPSLAVDVRTLIDGFQADAGVSGTRALIDDKIKGIDLIEDNITLGGVFLPAGTILLGVQLDGIEVMDNNLLVNGEDIFAVTVSKTTLDDSETRGTASLVFDGDDLGLTTGGGNPDRIDGFSIRPTSNSSPTGAPTISGTATEDQMLTADASGIADADGLGAFSYQWLRDGNPIVGATAINYTLDDADVGATIKMKVTYTDGSGSAESVTSAPTTAVANINDPLAGSVTIDDTTPAQGDTLTVSNTLTDADGLSGAITYQWQRDGADIGAETGSTYTTVQADVGAVITVKASYTDDNLTDETKTSAATAAVTNVNDLPAGTVTIDNGTPAQGDTLTASNTLSDADGLSGAISYQWQRDGVDIGGETGSTYTTVQADVGAVITVAASYTDDLLTDETKTSAATAAVTNVNNLPAGAVTIDNGTPVQGDTLTASNTLTDADGLSGAISYQWQRDGADIVGAIGSTYTTVQADVGAAITVVASYTDDLLTDETKSSAATAIVTDLNDAPTGSVSITGTATLARTLSADTASLADADGLNPFGYQWLRDDVAIGGATGIGHVLTAADVGAVMKVVVSYTDGGGTPESVTSAGTTPVTSSNVDPTGAVTIDGFAAEDNLLAANTTTIADADGLTAFSYQWLRDGALIPNATASNYSLSDADVGATIKVKVNYTDAGGTGESLISSATAAIINVNDPVIGSPLIVGEASNGNTLTADTTALNDADGMGTINYQWLRDGVTVAGANAGNYTLENADVGATMSVTVSYTDAHGTAESVTSANTAAVTNINRLPAGSVTIDNTAPAEGDTLTASNSLSDADGLSGDISYQWLRDGVDIGGGTGSTYTTVPEDVDAVISVAASYTDDFLTPESMTSAATAPVSNVNDGPLGTVDIDNAAPAEGDTLTAINTLTDADGLGEFSYQWLRNDVPIALATASTYAVGDDDIGATIKVEVSYTDTHGTDESVTSNATAPVTNVNAAPTGSPVIAGALAKGTTLTANTDALDDGDGLGPFSYQWLRDGAAVAGATGENYTLADADVGGIMSVEVSYTDGWGTGESVTSAGTEPVANVNSAPTGVVVIAGAALENDVLTADTSALEDVDGLGALSYQWLRGGGEIAGATGSGYTLVADDVGAAVSVRVSYTDDQGAAENATSAATGPVLAATIPAPAPEEPAPETPAPEAPVPEAPVPEAPVPEAPVPEPVDPPGIDPEPVPPAEEPVPSPEGEFTVTEVLGSESEVTGFATYLNATSTVQSVLSAASDSASLTALSSSAEDPAVSSAAEAQGEQEPGESTSEENSTADTNTESETGDADVDAASDKKQGLLLTLGDQRGEVILESIAAEIQELLLTVGIQADSAIVAQVARKDTGSFFRNAMIEELSSEEASFASLRQMLGSFGDVESLLEAGGGFVDGIDQLREDVREEEELQKMLVGSGFVTTTGLSVGYVIWIARSGVLLSSVLSSMPAWRLIDPFPVLSSLGQTSDGGDDESLQSIAAQSDGDAAAEVPVAAAADTTIAPAVEPEPDSEPVEQTNV